MTHSAAPMDQHQDPESSLLKHLSLDGSLLLPSHMVPTDAAAGLYCLTEVRPAAVLAAKVDADLKFERLASLQILHRAALMVASI